MSRARGMRRRATCVPPETEEDLVAPAGGRSLPCFLDACLIDVLDRYRHVRDGRDAVGRYFSDTFAHGEELLMTVLAYDALARDDAAQKRNMTRVDCGLGLDGRE